jgi:hypothetical protein
LLLVGALLAPGKRTGSSGLRIIGLSPARRFVNYQRVLRRARWSGPQARRLLLGRCVSRLVPTGPMVFGLDDTIERRRGQRIPAQGIYRDPGRRAHSPFVKARGGRWMRCMRLTPLPWAARTWALPLLTCRAPSERYRQRQHKRHKPRLDGARPMILPTQRWLPKRAMVILADSAFAALQGLPALVRQNILVITRRRGDAALYPPAPFRPPGTQGRPRKVGNRLSTRRPVLAPTATRWQRLTGPNW